MSSSSSPSPTPRFQQLLDAANEQLRARGSEVAAVARSTWITAKSAVQRAIGWVLDKLGPLAPIARTIGSIAFDFACNKIGALLGKRRRKVDERTSDRRTTSSAYAPDATTSVVEQIVDPTACASTCAPAASMVVSSPLPQEKTSDAAASSSPVPSVATVPEERVGDGAREEDPLNEAQDAGLPARNRRLLAGSLRQLLGALHRSRFAEAAAPMH